MGNYFAHCLIWCIITPRYRPDNRPAAYIIGAYFAQSQRHLDGNPPPKTTRIISDSGFFYVISATWAYLLRLAAIVTRYAAPGNRPALRVSPMVDNAKPSRKAWQHPTTSSTARGYGSAWQRLRLIVLARDNGLCQCPECKSSGRIRKAREVDHIVSKAKAAQLGWTQRQVDSLDNLRSVHSECHKRITMRDQGRNPGQLFDAGGRVVW